MNRATAVQVFSALAIAAGLAVSYYPPVRNAEAIWALIGGFLGFAAKELFGPSTASAPPVPPADKQAGRAQPLMLVMLAACAALAMSLTGCASQLQAVTAFNKSAMVSIRATADIAADDAVAGLCAMSIDTLSRHPEYVDGIVTLCLKNAVTPASVALKTSIVLTPPAAAPTTTTTAEAVPK